MFGTFDSFLSALGRYQVYSAGCSAKMNNKSFIPVQQERQQALRLYFPTIYCALLFAWCLIQQIPGGSKGCIDCQACLYRLPGETHLVSKFSQSKVLLRCPESAPQLAMKAECCQNALDQNAKGEFAESFKNRTLIYSLTIE